MTAFLIGLALRARGLLSAIAAFLRTPAGRKLLIGLGVLALLWLIWAAGTRHGHQSERAKWERAAASARASAAKADAKADRAATEIRQATEKTRVEIQVRTRYLTKEVPIYVTPAADARCVVPTGFVRLYDAAASGQDVPQPSGGPDDADSGVALSAVAETDVANLGAAREAIAEVRAWRAWYPKVKAAMEGR